MARVAVLISVLLLLVACGQKGDLYLPSDVTPQHDVEQDDSVSEVPAE